MIANFIPDIPERLSIISRHEARVISDLILQGEIDEDESEMAKGEVPQGPPVSQPPIGFFSLEHPEFEVG